MKRAALLFICATCPAAATATQEQIVDDQRILPMDAGTWLNLGEARSDVLLNVQLISADVQVVPSRSDRIEVSIRAIAGGADLSRLRLLVTRSANEIALKDLFPQRYVTWAGHECLPPSGERGDVWAVPGRYHFTIRAPRLVRVVR